MKIICTKRLDGSLKPRFEADEEAFKRIKAGEDVAVEITQPRDLIKHRKFFALINLVFNNQDVYTNATHLRHDLTVEAGFFELGYNFHGEEVRRPLSISFAKMEQDVFEDLYDKFIIAIIRNFHFELQDVLDEIAKF
jgi:hypothetical protein